MVIANGFLPFTLGLLLLIENEAKEARKTDPDAIYSGADLSAGVPQYVDHDKQIRPLFSNINDLIESDWYGGGHARTRRKTPERSIASIMKKLNEEKRREEMMASDANPRMEPNYTGQRLLHPLVPIQGRCIVRLSDFEGDRGLEVQRVLAYATTWYLVVHAPGFDSMPWVVFTFGSSGL